MVWRIIRLRWPKPLPLASKLLPFIFSNWNAAKGGSDTITKHLWTIKCNPPNKLAQAHAIGRILHLNMIQIHRCGHIATSKQSLPYKSLLHYRNASNKRSSLHKTIIEISHCFDSANEAPTTPRRVSVSPEQPSPTRDIQLVGHSLRGSKPILKLQATAIPITGSTPQRGIKKKFTRLLDGSDAPKGNQSLVVDRVRKCTGIPVYRNNARGLCIICGKETYWYCMGCHVCLCMTDVSKAKNADDFDCFEMDITIPALQNSGAASKQFHSVNKCYLHHHCMAIFDVIGAASSSDSSSSGH